MKKIIVLILLILISQVLHAEELPTSIYDIELGDDINQIRAKYEQCSEPIDEFTEGVRSVICEIEGNIIGVSYYVDDQVVAALQRFIESNVDTVMEQLTRKYGEANASLDTGAGKQRYWTDDKVRLIALDFTVLTPTTMVEIADVQAIEAHEKKTAQDALDVFE